jgi:hypothetical protein
MPNEIVRERRRQSVADEELADDWVERELAGCQFKDERLGKRFRTLLGQLAEGTGESIPMACQDWANTKAAYRFLSNDRVNEQEILAGHFEASVRASWQHPERCWFFMTRRSSASAERMAGISAI